MLKRAFAISAIGTMLLAPMAFAQAPGPVANDLVSAPPSPTTLLTHEEAGQWRAAILRGVAVYDGNHDCVGEIRDVLVDRDGKIDAVVIGVGGFLGFGERDVALGFDQIRWEPGDGAAHALAYPDHAVVAMTKDQLLASPEFHYSR